MSPRSAVTDQGHTKPLAVGTPSVVAAITPKLSDFPAVDPQLVLEVAVSLAYDRGFSDGDRFGLATGHAVRFRVDRDEARRLDDARTGDYRSGAAARDGRLMDSLRSTGIITERAA